ncbi:MAG: hypothetical protein HRU18_19960 [Pseudoalteromonas sp.]|uniref:hypothetical protein n=1 Tax=Pseudoalteromonas sp. TaxID=53249 RepID=UPI001D4E826E|nr:hypothetical protein [Pseudoalteromonas sp.]NRA80483.1 hypothetical protein [Pseudoalteromonas sp.]
MTTRKASILKTKKRLLDAFERLKDGSFTSTTLKNKNVVKVNAYNVEIESGSSIGTLRNHPEIKQLIENYDPNSDYSNNENLTPSERKLSKALDANEKLKAQLKKLKIELKSLKEKNITLSKKLENSIAEEHELIVALMSKIDINECKAIFKDQSSHLTVIQHDFKR